MELHQLRAFINVAATGSLNEAAKKCGISQPTLSRAVQQLELELGTPLFIREKGRNATLTSEGETFLPEATRIIEAVESLQAQWSKTWKCQPPPLKVGMMHAFFPGLLPRVVGKLEQKCPSVRVLLTEAPSPDLIEQVESGGLELAIVKLPIRTKSLQSEILFTERLLLVFSRSHPWATNTKIPDLEALRSSRFVLLDEKPCCIDPILNHLNVYLKCPQIEVVLESVALGLGVSLVPETARLVNKSNDLLFRPFEKPKLMRTVAVVWRKGQKLNQTTFEFLKYLRRESEALLKPPASTSTTDLSNWKITKS